MPPQGKEVKLSKALSFILRHGATASGLSMRPDGFVLVSELLALPKFKAYKPEAIFEVVASNEKQRFTVCEEEPGVWWIRANQGHSLLVPDLELRWIRAVEEAPEVVVHGTQKALWPAISRGGLRAMSRNHIHMAKGRFGDPGVVSGMRARCDLFLYLDVARALTDGIRLYESTNGTILSPGLGETGAIPMLYFARVLDDTGRELVVDGVIQPET